MLLSPHQNDAIKDPISVSDGFEVFLLDPSFSFVRMSSTTPPPYRLKDGVVYILKGFFADDMAKIITPPSNDGVKFSYQFT